MKKIAILYICTGKYYVLWRDFYKSFESYFLPEALKEYFVFTDNISIDEKKQSRVHKIFQNRMDWPYPTLLRFKMFQRIETELYKFDYIFFFNANAKALDIITEEMVLPREDKKEKLVMVTHPMFGYSIIDNPYDRNIHSHAFIPYGFGKHYVQACILGGTKDAFLNMTNCLSSRIDKDLRKKIIALWHDESYVNRYLLFRKDYRLLGREFSRIKICEHEKNYILMRPKEDYFDVKKEKDNAPETQLSKVNIWINNVFKYIYLAIHSEKITKLPNRCTKKIVGEGKYNKIKMMIKRNDNI